MNSILNLTTGLMLLSVVIQAVPIKSIAAVKKKVVFEVVLDEGIKNKPFLLVYEKGIDENDKSKTGQKNIQPSLIKGNSYFFDLKDQSKPLYFSLLLADPLMDLTVAREFHFEPGDQMKIIVKKTQVANIYDVDFSGIGSAKYRCQNEFRNAMCSDTVKTLPDFSSDNSYNLKNQSLRYTTLLYRTIEKYRPEMSDYSYNLVHADILGSFGSCLFIDLGFRLNRALEKNDTVSFKRISKDFSGKYQSDFVSGIPDSVLTNSKEYANFILQKIKTEVLIDFAIVNYNIVYERIKRINNTALRDKLIISFFRQSWGKLNNNYEGVLKDALSVVKNKEDLEILKTFDHHNAGSTAFNFSLPDVNGKKVRLSNFKGKIVFIDFWFVGCVWCESYYKSVLSQVEKKYADNPNIVFITVSIDKNKDKWLKGVISGDYTSSKIVNLYTNGEGNSNEIIKYYNIVGYPSPMLVGRKGEIIKFSGKQLRRIDNLIAAIDMAVK